MLISINGDYKPFIDLFGCKINKIKNRILIKEGTKVNYQVLNELDLPNYFD